MCLVSDMLSSTLRDLQNMCDLVSPNRDSIGFTILFAKVLSHGLRLGLSWFPALADYLNQSESFTRIFWRKSVIVSFGPEAAEATNLKGPCHLSAGHTLVEE